MVARLLTMLRDTSHTIAISVVDNSSDAALKSLVEDHGAIYISPDRNLGYGAGHNLGMLHAIEQSTYHLICNPDIECGPAVLSELAEFMDLNPQVGLVMPKVLYPDGREQRLCKRLPTPGDLLLRRFAGPAGKRLMQRSLGRYELCDVDLGATRQVPSLSGCFMFLRSAVLRQIGLFDPRFFMYMEDVDLCRRVGAVSHTVFYPRVSVTHGYAKGSYKDPRLLRFHIASAVRYFNKWGWFHDPLRDELNRRTELWRETEMVARSEMQRS
jgi:GT2 family glycosyltransferase